MIQGQTENKAPRDYNRGRLLPPLPGGLKEETLPLDAGES